MNIFSTCCNIQEVIVRKPCFRGPVFTCFSCIVVVDSPSVALTVHVLFRLEIMLTHTTVLVRNYMYGDFIYVNLCNYVH